MRIRPGGPFAATPAAELSYRFRLSISTMLRSFMPPEERRCVHGAACGLKRFLPLANHWRR